MATLQDLENAIRGLFQQSVGSSSAYRVDTSTAPKAYEGYIFGLCLRAVRELGAIPVLCGNTGPANPFIFRGGPGHIHSTYRNYGYAYFHLNNHEFEVHPGIEISGTSGMTHELDVCIIRADDARDARSNRQTPSAAALVAGWECKFYDTPLQKHLARAFVGLMDDMGSNCRMSGLCSNQTHPQMADYFEPQRRPYPHLPLTPLDSGSENRFVGTLSAMLKRLAKA